VDPCSEGREKSGGLTHKRERQRGVCFKCKPVLSFLIINPKMDDISTPSAHLMPNFKPTW
jgi:hypothetical protein